MNERGIRERWEDDREKLSVLEASFKLELNEILREAGIFADLEHRIKEIDSIIKKMLKKGKKYEDVHDKLGFRIIVKFQNDLKTLDRIIQKNLGGRIVQVDNKSKNLSDSVFGYQSIHYDLVDLNCNLHFELQVRTICQHNWSLMSHSLSYKNEDFLPIEIKRKINALSALFEVADTQFQSISDSVLSIKEDFHLKLVCFLETVFFRITSFKDYDREMTNYFLAQITKLYVQGEETLDILNSFIENNEIDLSRYICNDRICNVFYSQPEIIIILERLVNKKILLKKVWENIYPLEYLEEIAIIWGTSIN